MRNSHYLTLADRKLPRSFKLADRIFKYVPFKYSYAYCGSCGKDLLSSGYYTTPNNGAADTRKHWVDACSIECLEFWKLKNV